MNLRKNIYPQSLDARHRYLCVPSYKEGRDIDAVRRGTRLVAKWGVGRATITTMKG